MRRCRGGAPSQKKTCFSFRIGGAIIPMPRNSTATWRRSGSVAGLSTSLRTRHPTQPPAARAERRDGVRPVRTRLTWVPLVSFVSVWTIILPCRPPIGYSAAATASEARRLGPPVRGVIVPSWLPCPCTATSRPPPPPLFAWQTDRGGGGGGADSRGGAAAARAAHPLG